MNINQTAYQRYSNASINGASKGNASSNQNYYSQSTSYNTHGRPSTASNVHQAKRPQTAMHHSTNNG